MKHVFALLLSLALAGGVRAQFFPAPTEWAAPAGLPAAPGDAYAPPGAGAPAAGAPVVAAWNETVLPGEPFTLTGANFTTLTGANALSDTKVWLWATGLAAPLRLRLDPNPVLNGPAHPLACCDFNSYSAGNLPASSAWVLNSRVPSTVPFGQYLVWVENAQGRSAPVPLNRPQLTWLGPRGNVAAPGAEHRAFGKNLSTGHGTAAAYAYAQPAAGGALVPLAVTAVEPYAVAFRAPAAAGAYNIWVHSGHGGAYGWGGPLPLTVAVPWQRDAREIVVAPSGGEDSDAINAAARQMGGPTGGTVRLLAGTYTIGGLWLLEGVRLLGAGKNQTRLESRTADSNDFAALMPAGDHVTIQDLTLLLTASSAPSYGAYKPVWPGQPHHDLDLLGVRFQREAGTKADADIDYYAIDRAEIANCEFELTLSPPPNAWVHDNVFHGGRMGPPENGAESAVIANGWNLVFERNHAETPNWPTGPGGSRNYNDFLTVAQLQDRTWCRRLLISGGTNWSSVENWYVAHNSTTDVAIDENKGETVLLHGVPSRWVAQVAGATPTTVSIRTDGTVYGQSQFNPAYSNPIAPARSVPTQVAYGDVLDGGAYAVVVQGPGAGQARQVVAAAAATLTVDRPWRVLPTAQSVITVAFLYRNQVVYDNQFQGFPAGYQVRQHSASCGVQFDGNCWETVSENNTTTRTAGTFNVGGSDTGPTYWSTMRNVQAIDPLYYPDYTLWSWAYDNPRVGLDLVGTRFAEAEASQPLPVELTRFAAQCAPGGGVQLRWQTASERNSLAFAVERSLDGRAFEAVGRVAAAGNSAAPRAYAYLDPAPDAGTAYYRLRQTDRDGRSAYSPAVAARCSGPHGPGGERMLLSPNPAAGGESVRLVLPQASAAPRPVEIELHTAVGTCVRREQRTVAASALDLSTADLPAGLYFVAVRDGAQRFSEKLVVAK